MDRTSAPTPRNPSRADTGFSVFNHFDYRDCLACYFRHKKAMNPRFSYRVFARKAGYKNAGLYIQLVNGRLNLTRDMLARFIKGMDLDTREAEYFSLMVQFTLGSTPEAKQHWFDKMLPMLPKTARTLTRDQAEYYRHWYNVAVREALSVLDVADDPEPLAEFLQPPITPRQAGASVKLLAALDLIRKDGDGHWRATDLNLESTPALGPFLIHPFQEALIELGKESLKRYPRDKRNVSCFTYSISEEGDRRLRLKVEQFLGEVADLVRSDKGMDRVCQFNIQVFPLTREKP